MQPPWAARPLGHAAVRHRACSPAPLRPPLERRSAGLRPVGTQTGRRNSAWRPPGAVNQPGCAPGCSRTTARTWPCGRCRIPWRDAALRVSDPRSTDQRRPDDGCRALRQPCRRSSAGFAASRRAPVRCGPPTSAWVRGTARWRRSVRPGLRRPSGRAARTVDASRCGRACSAASLAHPVRSLRRREPRRCRAHRPLPGPAARTRRGPGCPASNGVHRP